MNFKKSLIIGVLFLTIFTILFPVFGAGVVYASEVNDIQQVEENIEITYDKQGNPLITVYEEDVESSDDILGIASKIPLGGSVLKGLLTAAGWTSAAGKVGSTIANQWDTNNNGKVEFYMRRGRGYRGEIVATQYQTR